MAVANPKEARERPLRMEQSSRRKLGALSVIVAVSGCGPQRPQSLNLRASSSPALLLVVVDPNHPPDGEDRTRAAWTIVFGDDQIAYCSEMPFSQWHVPRAELVTGESVPYCTLFEELPADGVAVCLLGPQHRGIQPLAIGTKEEIERIARAAVEPFSWVNVEPTVDDVIDDLRERGLLPEPGGDGR